MEQYMSKTRGNYGSGVVRLKINGKTHFELKGQFLKELRENTFSGSEHEDANEHIEKVLEIVDLFHIPEVTQDQVMLRAFPMFLTGAEVILFYNGLDVPTRQILNYKGTIRTKTAIDTKIAIQELAEYSKKWHNETSSKARSTKTSDGLAAIQAQLNNLGREIKKVNKKVYTAQVGCELCKGPHYTKNFPLKEEWKTLEKAYYTQFGAPYQPGGQYRAAGSGFYQRNNRNSSYLDRRQTLEESLTKFIAELAKRHEENSNIIKEIRASTDTAIRNQGASIKTLEIQIGQMSKVLQERGIKGMPGLTEPNPIDNVKSISTAKANSSAIHRIRLGPYAVSEAQYSNLSSKTVPFPSRLHALVDLGASVSVMPFSTYSNFGLDFVILDVPEDDDVPLILRRPFLFTVHAKIDVFKRKFTLGVGEEKLVFNSIKPATSIIRRVYMVKERTDLDSKTKFIGEAINESFDPLYEDVEPEPNLPLQEVIILDPDDQPMWESDKTVAPTPNSAIVQIDVDDNFVIKSTHLKMICENIFDGYLRADPHDHIREFLAICDMFKYGETQSEVVKLLIFPFSLCDKAKTCKLSEDHQNQDSHNSFSHQSHHDPNDPEKSLTELNNDVKNDLEDFKRCVRSRRTIHDKFFVRDDGKVYNADIRATNILLQGLPKDIYTLINHYTDAKDIWDNVKMLLEGSELTKEDRESQLYDDFEHFRPETKDETYFMTTIDNWLPGEAHANENKMMLDRFTQHTVYPLALMSNVSHPQYHSLSSTTLPSTYVTPHFADNTQPDTGISPTDKLNKSILTIHFALLHPNHTKKTYLKQTNTLKTSLLKTRNQATVQVRQGYGSNVQGRQNKGQGNNPLGGGATGYGGAQNRVGNTNPGQARQIKCYNYNAQRNGVGGIACKRLLLFLAAWTRRQLLLRLCYEHTDHDLALNVDNVFQVNDCDAFDSDVDEAPMAQTMFMANLSSADPVYDEAGPSYDSDILSEVPTTYEQYQEAVCEQS
ncbi:hypothetical protein Tco_1164034 [Tanacetum coccineum]